MSYLPVYHREASHTAIQTMTGSPLHEINTEH